MADLVASTSGPRVKVVVDVREGLTPVKADPNQLEMAILNLAVNARDAMPDGGQLTIAAAEEKVEYRHRSKLPRGHYVRLSVSDTGIGMDEATLARAIEPFFSTKGVGKGTGLGLSMVHGLAAQLGGALTIKSRPGVGTSVELWLPAMAGTVQQPDGPEEAVHLAAAGTALLVDDEDIVRVSTADMLSDLGYAVVETASAKEALALIEGGLVPDVVITDHLMPGMTGTDLAHVLKGRRPGMPVLIISGYAEDDGIAPDLPRLTKPFRQSELTVSLSKLTKAVVR
jgi:CheY-like chemotaxis protein